MYSICGLWRFEVTACLHGQQPTELFCLRRGKNLNPKQSLAAAIVLDKLVRFYCLPLLVRRSARTGKARHISPRSAAKSCQRRQQHALGVRWLWGRKAKLTNDTIPSHRLFPPGTDHRTDRGRRSQGVTRAGRDMCWLNCALVRLYSRAEGHARFPWKQKHLFQTHLFITA